MINSADYTPDGKFLVLEKFPGEHEPKKVPVALIDELIERGLSSYSLQRLLFVRRVTVGKKTRKVKLEDLAAEDLTGKTVGIYFRNYDDSEWMSTDKAIGVKQDSNDSNYHFVFPADYETCWEGNCSHYDEDALEDRCFRDDLQGYYFWGNDTVLITWDEEVNA